MKTKSGKEVLDVFFNTIENLPEVDKQIAQSIAGLYRSEKLTTKNIANALLQQRDKQAVEK